MWVVDRIEGTFAVLISDAGQQFTVPRGRFREGQVYRVNSRGLLVRNRPEERRRLRTARSLLALMKASDPGGDIVIR